VRLLKLVLFLETFLIKIIRHDHPYQRIIIINTPYSIHQQPPLKRTLAIKNHASPTPCNPLLLRSPSTFQNPHIKISTKIKNIVPSLPQRLSAGRHPPFSFWVQNYLLVNVKCGEMWSNRIIPRQELQKIPYDKRQKIRQVWFSQRQNRREINYPRLCHEVNSLRNRI
jgi:hypothetical protein